MGLGIRSWPVPRNVAVSLAAGHHGERARQLREARWRALGEQSPRLRSRGRHRLGNGERSLLEDGRQESQGKTLGLLPLWETCPRDGNLGTIGERLLSNLDPGAGLHSLSTY